MEAYERIRERRIALGMTQQQLADAVGFKSRAAVNKIEKGLREINQRNVMAFAAALNTTVPYLLEGKTDPAIPQGFVPMPEMETVPLLGEIACGVPILAQQNITELIPKPARIHADFALVCKGDSMIGAGIEDGDIVYIRQQDTFENGQIAAVRIGDEATLKRVYRNGDTVVLNAANPAYAPIVLSADQFTEISVEGVAVGFTRVFR